MLFLDMIITLVNSLLLRSLARAMPRPQPLQPPRLLSLAAALLFCALEGPVTNRWMGVAADAGGNAGEPPPVAVHTPSCTDEEAGEMTKTCFTANAAAVDCLKRSAADRGSADTRGNRNLDSTCECLNANPSVSRCLGTCESRVRESLCPPGTDSNAASKGSCSSPSCSERRAGNDAAEAAAGGGVSAGEATATPREVDGRPNPPTTLPPNAERAVCDDNLVVEKATKCLAEAPPVVACMTQNDDVCGCVEGSPEVQACLGPCAERLTAQMCEDYRGGKVRDGDGGSGSVGGRQHAAPSREQGGEKAEMA